MIPRCSNVVLFPPRCPARDATDASEQFFEAERFRKIIVGPYIQPPEPVVQAVPGAQDDDRFIEPGFSPLAEQFQPVAIRKAEIKDDDVVRALRQRIRSLRLGPSEGRGIGGFFQAVRNKAADLIFVLYDKDSH